MINMFKIEKKIKFNIVCFMYGKILLLWVTILILYRVKIVEGIFIFNVCTFCNQMLKKSKELK